MNKRRLMLFLALFLWILFIFGHSLQPAAASTQESDSVRRLLSLLLRCELASAFVRKLAHFVEFWVLGALAACFFAGWAGRLPQTLFYSAVLGMMTALCDETIQLFVAGRDGRILDVWLDFAGSCTGAAMVLAVLYFARRYGPFARGRAAASKQNELGAKRKR